MAPPEVRTPHSRVPSPVSILTDLSQLPVFSDYSALLLLLLLLLLFRSNTFALSSNTGQPGADFHPMSICAKGQRTGPRAKFKYSINITKNHTAGS